MARFRDRWLGTPPMPLGAETAPVPARRSFLTSALGFGVGLSTPLGTPSGVIKSNAPLPLTAGRSRVSDTLRISVERVRNEIGQVGVLKATGHLVP